MLTALAPLCACQSGQKKTAANDSTAAAILAPAEVPAARSFYKQYKGQLAGQPVTLQLVKYAPGKYEGWYVYDKVGEPIGIALSREWGDSLSFAEYAGADNENLLTGALAGGRFSGIWTGGGKTFPFDMTEDMDSLVTFDAFLFADSAKLRPDDPASPQAQASAAMVWPLGGTDAEVTAFLRKAMQPQLQPGDMPVQALKSSVMAYLSDYQGNGKVTDSADLEYGTSTAWNWESHGTESVVWNKYPLLVIAKMDYEYSGGAHGNYGTRFDVYDIAAKKKLAVTDVFKPGYQRALGVALEKAFRKQFRVAAGESLEKGFLFEPHIAPNDNFYLTDKGAVFSYVPYEIAAYAVGQITLFVPWADIRPIVQPAYLPKP